MVDAPAQGSTHLTKPRSTRFREEREARWSDLEALVTRLEKGARLNTEEMTRLTLRYREALSALSVARLVSLDRYLIRYLEDLSARAYGVLYGLERQRHGPGRFFAWEVPRAVRQARWMIALAALTLAAALAVGIILTLLDEQFFYSMVPQGLAGNRGPDASRDELLSYIYPDASDFSQGFITFANFLLNHNSLIGLLAFGLGVAFGLPSLLLVFYQGLAIGPMIAVHIQADLGWDFTAWLMIHGTTELLSICLFAGAGLYIGQSLAFPGRRSRLEALRQGAQVGTVVATTALILMGVAAILEGFFRQLITAPELRVLTGAVFLLLWLTWFGLLGRGTDSSDEGKANLTPSKGGH